MRLTHTIEETRAARRELGEVAFVPTMGALHDGHLSLIRRARERADHVAVSIFVNPTQFGAGEDYETYPRTLREDLARCEEAGVSLVFAPEASHIYPPHEPAVVVDVPALTGDLEGEHRPGHFVGVCRVVAKLLGIVLPDVALFGEKDLQQLRVVEAMVRGLCLPVAIEACPTVREADGLATSSRNSYLTREQRKRALGLSKALREGQGLIDSGETQPEAVEEAMRQVLHAHRVDVEYAVVRDSRTLRPVDLINPTVEPVACLVAGRVDGVHLIDNALIGRERAEGGAGG